MFVYCFLLFVCLVLFGSLGILLYMLCIVIVFFFKQKTAYEMRISDWSSDVCSSDLGSCISEGPGASTWVCPDCSRCAFIYSPSRKWNGQGAGWRPHDRFLKTITNSPGSILSIHSMKM